MKLPDFRSDLQKNAEKQLQGFGYKLRGIPTSAGTGTYRSLNVGETADKIKRGIKKIFK